MSSALGGALGMSSTYTWTQVVTAITGVVNRGEYSKTFTPTTSYQSASSGAGYYSSVSVACNAVSLSGNAGTGQVLSGYTFYNTSLTRQTGTMANRGNLNWSGSNTTYSVPAGYYSGGTLNSRPSYTNGYNAGVSVGKLSAYSSKTLSAISNSSGDLSCTKYIAQNILNANTGKATNSPYVSFNTNVSKVIAIRMYIKTGAISSLYYWFSSYSSRVISICSDSNSGFELGPVGTSSSTTFWVNGTNARLPLYPDKDESIRGKTVNIQIWYY